MLNARMKAKVSVLALRTAYYLLLTSHYLLLTTFYLLPKVSVFALGNPFAEVAARLEARAAWSWLSQATAELDYAELVCHQPSLTLTSATSPA